MSRFSMPETMQPFYDRLADDGWTHYTGSHLPAEVRKGSLFLHAAHVAGYCDIWVTEGKTGREVRRWKKSREVEATEFELWLFGILEYLAPLERAE